MEAIQYIMLHDVARVSWVEPVLYRSRTAGSYRPVGIWMIYSPRVLAWGKIAFLGNDTTAVFFSRCKKNNVGTSFFFLEYC